jgi:hypothetical protein
MKKFMIVAIAAVVIGLGISAGSASAAWITRTVYRWDPVVGGYVPVVQRIWVPDPVYYEAPVYVAPRPWWSFGLSYYPHHHHEHHEHHHH